MHPGVGLAVKSIMKDGEFYYLELGWANYTLQQRTAVAGLWAEALGRGDVRAAEDLYKRMLGLSDALTEQTQGKF